MDNSIEAKAQKAFDLKIKYSRLYDRNQDKEAEKLEIEYLTLRKEVLLDIESSNARQRSEPIIEVKKRVAGRKTVRIETGISVLDKELVNEKMKARNVKGGFALGNYIQLAGSKGSGKSSIMLKILTGFSLSEKVCWFDFEMGEARVVDKLISFKHNENNLLYYGSSRLLSDVADEIKLLNAIGIRHFVVDSAMKIVVPNTDNYNRFSAISSLLSELTSKLGINIYMINQMSQSSEKEGHLSIKHGNDAEYDADFIFFIMKIKAKDEKGDYMEDDFGMPLYEENTRIIKCVKNRQDERLFTLEIPKSAIFGIEVETTEYQE